MKEIACLFLLSALLDQVSGMDIALCGPQVDSRGNLDMDKSLFYCAANMMNDPHQPITHVKMYVDKGIELSVKTKFEFNNLVSVNELENTATVDFFFRYVEDTQHCVILFLFLLCPWVLLILYLLWVGVVDFLIVIIMSRLWWQDLRWNMTEEFWDLAPVSVYYDGVELDSLMYNSEPTLPIWKPDLHFIDVLEIETFAQLIKLRRGKLNLYMSLYF